MKLYSESKELIYYTQHRDPFFLYLTGKLLKPLAAKNGGKVLDLGCGSGRNTLTAARMGFDVLAVDINNKALEIAASHAREEGLEKRTKFVKADLLKIKKHKFGLFDFCILSEVIEHDTDFQKIIDFAYSSLKKGGELLLSTPNDPKQWNLLDDYAEHIKRFKKKELEESLAAFKKVTIFTVGFPFHRLAISTYHILLTVLNKKHQPRIFRKDSVIPSLYSMVGSTVLKIDDLFNFSGRGTTLIAIAEK